MNEQYIEYKFTYINNRVLYSLYSLIAISFIFLMISGPKEWVIVDILLVLFSRLFYKFPGKYRADNSEVSFSLLFSKFTINYEDIIKIDTEIKNIGYDRLLLSNIQRCRLEITTKQKQYNLEMDYEKDLSNMIDTPHELQKTIDSHPFKILEKYIKQKTQLCITV